MSDDRKPLLDRAAALVAAPFLLGREALGLVVRAAREAPEAPPGPTPVALTVTPPSHAIKRRG